MILLMIMLQGLSVFCSHLWNLLTFKIGSGQSHSLCYGGTLGSGYFRQIQVRKDKRRTKDFAFNYVDRIRFAESAVQNYHKCPTRNSGWRYNSTLDNNTSNNNNTSISHLDLATSCHSAAASLSQWPGPRSTRNLRHSRSLDYNHILHYRDALDIAEFYWWIDPEAEKHTQAHSHKEAHSPGHKHTNQLAKHTEETYQSTSSLYIATESGRVDGFTKSAGNSLDNLCGAGSLSEQLTALDFGIESCSLRRSQSLAVIREETFSDLHIPTTNNHNRRRSQLIPRARLVHRDFLRQRSICGKGKGKHHHHLNQSIAPGERDNEEPADLPSNSQHKHHQQQRASDDYYDNLNRLEALPACQQAWHNDKSDLESLNSDYFKHSLHQSPELEQQLGVEQDVALSSNEKTRVYRKRRLIISGTESCPENSQSSVFPETTPSNSDDQTDESPSLSEQEYDITKIEAIYKLKSGQNQPEDASDNCNDHDSNNDNDSYELVSLTTPTLAEGDAVAHDAQQLALATTEEFTGTLKRSRAVGNLEKLIAYDSVYLSSEEGSDDTLIEEAQLNDLGIGVGAGDESEPSTLLHISIEDPVYEAQAGRPVEAPIYTRVLRVEQPQSALKTTVRINTHTSAPVTHVGVTSSAASKPKILTVVERRKLKRNSLESTPVSPTHASHPNLSELSASQTNSSAYLRQQAHAHKPTTVGSIEASTHNQYHSLPDVHIGQSLKVSESIDAELRSSYHQHKYHCASIRFPQIYAKSVTSQQIYDSIQRFGQAHQRVRRQSSEPAVGTHSQDGEKPSTTIAVGQVHARAEQRGQQQEEGKLERRDEQHKNHNSGTFRVSNAHSGRSDSSAPQLPAESHNQSSKCLPFFRIIVTDAQDNIIEEDSIASVSRLPLLEPAPTLPAPTSHSQSECKLAAISSPATASPPPKPARAGAVRAEVIRARGEAVWGESAGGTSARGEAARREAARGEAAREEAAQSRGVSQVATPPTEDSAHSESAEQSERTKSKGRRVLGAQIYKARPIKVLPNHITAARTMSRPQILHVVEPKRRIHTDFAPTSSAGVQSEYLRKVDAIRCYWAKFASEQQQPQQQQGQGQGRLHDDQQHEEQREQSVDQIQVQVNECRYFEIGASQASQSSGSAQHFDEGRQGDNECASFMPSIEIVDLDGDGEKCATIVSAVDTLANEASEPQFDHIRYKVLKSQQLARSNWVARSRKDTRFNGLIQYLQEYSFQELLTNNNVVIVEPVRTKIERPARTNGIQTSRDAGAQVPDRPSSIPHKSDKPEKSVKPVNTSSTVTPVSCASNRHNECEPAKGVGHIMSGGRSIKRHFFYQPVRVNREMHEEELPHPDTVRTVRQFFEKHILPTPGQGLAVRHPMNECSQGDSNATQGPPKQPYLGMHAAMERTPPADASKQTEATSTSIARKWDTASISSGISSGGLSSLCEYSEQERQEHVAGVHVLDVVRHHNSRSQSERTDRETERPRSAVFISGREAGYYRDIYLCNAGRARQHHQHQHQYQHEHEHTLNSRGNGLSNNNCVSNATKSGDNDANDNENENDNEDVVEDEDDEPDNDDLCESYYVSNDVLEKIRECGSSVTYYGGRVLEHSLPEAPTTAKHQRSQPQQLAARSPPPPTRVRAWAHEIEQHKSHHASRPNDLAKDAYLGINLKLIKSNSCSSRLELTGTGLDISLVPATAGRFAETEGVSKMVDRFEHFNNDHKRQQAQRTRPSDPIFTVNTRVQQLAQQKHTSAFPLDVGTGTGTGTPTAVSTAIATAKMTHVTASNNSSGGEATERGGTSARSVAQDHHEMASSKVCRNKNVDLAFSMAKQQQQRQLVSYPASKPHPHTDSTSPSHRVDNSKIKACSEPMEVPTVMPSPHLGSFDELKRTPDGARTKRPAQSQEQGQGPERDAMHDNVQFEERARPTPSLSKTSSTASLMDKSVVRHYVANDKSLFERRKYDDIEFEEFEVYDPAKEIERAEEPGKAIDDRSKSSSLSDLSSLNDDPSGTDKCRSDCVTDCYDSLDDRL